MEKPKKEEIIPQNATLRRHSPVPLPCFYYSTQMAQFIGKDSLVLIHPDFNKKVAKRLTDEVQARRAKLEALKADGKSGDDHSGLIQYWEKLANVQVKKH